MARTAFLSWQNWEKTGLQHLILRETADRIVAEALVLGAPGAPPFAATFRVVCDAGWRARELELRILDSDRRLVLRGDGAGHWRDGDDRPLPELEGALDVDLPLTPFTNTLPIRRLGLHAGEAADLAVAYVNPPELGVIKDPQRYQCLEPLKRYRYESLDSDFVREIEVDADGLVLSYPGLFRRVS